MKKAMNQQEAPEAGSPPEEIPALLVAGGSCSRLCRAQRATPDDSRLPRSDTEAMQRTQNPRAEARE